MSDIDDLLSELDAIDRGEYSSSRVKPPASGGGKRPAATPAATSSNASSHPRRGANTIGDLLDELSIIEGPSRGRLSQPPPAASRAAPSAPSTVRASQSHGTAEPGRPQLRQKCISVMLGPVGSSWGRFSGVGGPVCCDSLRCTRCDFKVLRFSGVAWHQDVDYLFFRNRYPDEDKLRQKLKKCLASSAYACQCQWISCTDIQQIEFGSDMRWTCAGHLCQ